MARKIAAREPAAPTVRVPGVYRAVLREWCRAEAVEQLSDPLTGVLAGPEADVLAEELFAERAGQPLSVRWYVFKDADLLPLPAPLDEVGSGRGPRRLRVWPDDRVDAAEWAADVAAKYEKARHFPGCDQAFFQAAAALTGAVGH